MFQVSVDSPLLNYELDGWCIESEIIDTFNAFRKEYGEKTVVFSLKY